MRRKTKAIFIIIACASALGVFGIWMWIAGRPPTYPDTLAEGKLPLIYLPVNNFSNVSYIRGYGQVEPIAYHNGIDFDFNDTAPIVAPCNAYVSYIQPNWYYEVSHAYQTNIHLRLNAQWLIEILFESFAPNATAGGYQFGNVSVSVGDYVTTNQSIGTLLHHADLSVLHISVRSYDVFECPYRFFNGTAQVLYEEQWERVGIKTYCSYYCCECC